MRSSVRCVTGSLLAAAAALLTACGSGRAEAQDPTTSGVGAVRGQAAHARLEPTRGYRTSGDLTFVREDDEVRVQGTVSGLTPRAKHGFHIHEFGDCSAPDASTAGDHFAPRGAPHGRPGEGEHHLGDLENLEADAAGEARVDQSIVGARLGDGSSLDLVGRSVIVHLAEDDYETQPAGGAGARIACGVIRPHAP